jgi:hypothetical protein
MSTEHAVWAMIKDETKSEKVRAVLSRTLLAAYWFQTTELESAIDHEGDKVSICIADCGCVSSPLYQLLDGNGDLIEAWHDPLRVLESFKEITDARET